MATVRLLRETVLSDGEWEFTPGTSGTAHVDVWRDYRLDSRCVPACDGERRLTRLEGSAGSHCHGVTYADQDGRT